MILLLAPVIVALAVAYVFVVIVCLIAKWLATGAWAIVRYELRAMKARRARRERLELELLELPKPVERSAHGPSASPVWRRTSAR